MRRHQQLGRLAVRVEGEYWVAYYAEVGTMQDALPLAYIRADLIRSAPERRDAFLAFMRSIVAGLIEEAIGRPIEYSEPQAAPDHERSGGVQ